MSFVEDADSLRAKLGISQARVPVVIGIALVALVVCALIAWTVLGAASSPGIVVEKGGEGESSQADVAPEQAERTVFVHVAGAVVAPGMYELRDPARVQDAIAAAGGFAEGAAEQSVNLARTLADGEQIMVAEAADPALASSGEVPPTSGAVVAGKVNINLASSSELQTLSGVGEATAEKIIAYRESHGSFKSIEELKNVSGIGDKKFEKLKDAIVV